MSFNLIAPVATDNVTFVSSTVPEDDYGAWNSGTTYALDDQAIDTTLHRIYRSLQASNVGHVPASSPTWWQDVGATNRWAMFDSKVGTVTRTTSSPLEVEIAPGMAVDSAAVLDLESVDSVTIELTSGATVWSRTETMSNAGTIFNWYGYFTQTPVQKRSFIFEDLPPLAAPTVKVTFTGGGTIGVGTLVLGNSFSLGDLLYGATIGIIDYSKKSTDEFGVVSVIERAYAKTVDARLVMSRYFVDEAVRVLTALRATAVVYYDTAAGYDSLIVYGFYKDWKVEIAYPNYSYCNLRLEGLT